MMWKETHEMFSRDVNDITCWLAHLSNIFIRASDNSVKTSFNLSKQRNGFSGLSDLGRESENRRSPRNVEFWVFPQESTLVDDLCQVLIG